MVLEQEPEPVDAGFGAGHTELEQAGARLQSESPDPCMISASLSLFANMSQPAR